MKISEIYVYPIKSLRGTSLQSAVATRHGLEYDRRFMLLKVKADGLHNMAISRYPLMGRFLTDMVLPEEDENGVGSINVTFTAPGSTDSDKLEVPLLPKTSALETFTVDMHKSTTKAFKMPSEYNDWFSACFGFDVVLAYLGDNLRNVLFEDLMSAKNNSWTSMITSNIPLLGSSDDDAKRITFADCAAYLIISRTSVNQVSTRLPEDDPMDATKFRPNLVVEGADDPWEEDYWGALQTGNGADFSLDHNCVRCVSLNVDYNTGKFGKQESGKVLQKLRQDRQLDKGAKRSPIFGRYAFLNPRNGSKVLEVGDEINVTKLNTDRTTWNWVGLSL